MSMYSMSLRGAFVATTQSPVGLRLLRAKEHHPRKDMIHPESNHA